MKLKHFLLLGAIFSVGFYLWWWLSPYFWLDLTLEDGKLYQIRREIVLLEALAFYIAWRVTPESKPLL